MYALEDIRTLFGMFRLIFGGEGRKGGREKVLGNFGRIEERGKEENVPSGKGFVLQRDRRRATELAQSRCRRDKELVKGFKRKGASQILLRIKKKPAGSLRTDSKTGLPL